MESTEMLSNEEEKILKQLNDAIQARAEAEYWKKYSDEQNEKYQKIILHLDQLVHKIVDQAKGIIEQKVPDKAYVRLLNNEIEKLRPLRIDSNHH